MMKLKSKELFNALLCRQNKITNTYMISAGVMLGISIAVSLLAIVFIAYLPLKLKGFCALVSIVVNVLCTSYLSAEAITGNAIEFQFYAGTFAGNINVSIDSLSAWFILIINFTVLTGLLYGIGYLQNSSASSKQITFHWSLFVIFQLSMLWVCMLQNGFAFLVAWEIMSLSSMLLVIFEHHKPKTLKAGINYLVQMHLSIVLLSVAFIWIYFQTGSFNFSAIGLFFGQNTNIWLFLLFFAGFGLKAGFVPLHSWLPHAHPAAPSHISGVMSGVIVKLGIYGIIRTSTYLTNNFVLLGEIILIVSILSGLYGILNAAVHLDFKRMLAYCTIENIGIIGIGIGIGLIGLGNGSETMYYLGFGGALLHVLNHSLFKSLLFYSAGSVYRQTHTRDMDKLGGLIKSMPQTAIIFLIGAIAIGGIPPFNGFVSEFAIYKGLLEGIQNNTIIQSLLFIICLAGLSIIGGISVLTFTKTFGTIFLGNPRIKLTHEPKEVKMLMLVPQYLIIAVMLSVAFWPKFYFGFVNHILIDMNSNGFFTKPLAYVSLTENIGHIGLFFGIFVCIIIAVWALRTLAVTANSQIFSATWGCGYTAPKNNMQYSGKSFSKPLGKILYFLLIEKKKYKELRKGEIFPQKREYSSFYLDFIEHRIIDTITQRLIYAANYFKFVQNGRIQSYVVYGILFIITIILLSFFIKIA